MAQTGSPAGGNLSNATFTQVPLGGTIASNATVVSEIARQINGTGDGISALMKSESSARCVLETFELANSVPLQCAVMSTPIGEESMKWIVFYNTTLVGTKVVASIPFSSLITFSPGPQCIALCFAKAKTQYALVTKIQDSDFYEVLLNEVKHNSEFSLDFTDGSGATVFSSVSVFRTAVMKQVKARKLVHIAPEAANGVELLGKVDAIELSLCYFSRRTINFCAEARVKINHRSGIMGDQFKPRFLLHTMAHFIVVKKTKMAAPTPYLYIPWTAIVRVMIDSSDSKLLAIHLETEPLQMRSVILQFSTAPLRRQWIENCSSTCAQLHHQIAVDTGAATDTLRVALLTRRDETDSASSASTGGTSSGGGAGAGSGSSGSANSQLLATRVLIDRHLRLLAHGVVGCVPLDKYAGQGHAFIHHHNCATSTRKRRHNFCGVTLWRDDDSSPIFKRG